MAEPRELQALYEALETTPDDGVTLFALADWFDEHDAAHKAAFYRWLATQRKWPYQYHADSDLQHHFSEWQEGWFWWTTAQNKADWGYPPSCALPHALWSKLPHTFKYNPLVFKEFATLREAFEALRLVWHESLLSPPPNAETSRKRPRGTPKPFRKGSSS